MFATATNNAGAPLADANYTKYVDQLMMKAPDVTMIEAEEGQNNQQ